MLTKTMPSDLNALRGGPQVMRLQEEAEAIYNVALTYARDQMPPLMRKQQLPELLQNPLFLSKFKNGLVTGMTELIATYDSNVQAIYLFEESANPDAETEDTLPIDITVHLLLLVNANSAALGVFIEALDRGLTRHVNELPSKLLAERTSLLNVIPISQEDVRNNRGYAALLNSVFARPIKVWAWS